MFKKITNIPAILAAYGEVGWHFENTFDYVIDNIINKISNEKNDR